MQCDTFTDLVKHKPTNTEDQHIIFCGKFICIYEYNEHMKLVTFERNSNTTSYKSVHSHISSLISFWIFINMPVFKLTYSALTDLLIYKNLVILLLFVVLDEEKERGEPLRLLAPLLEHLLQILTECTFWSWRLYFFLLF